MMTPRSRRALLGVTAALALAVAIGVSWLRREETYVELHSPDGRFSVVVKRRPMLFAMPGGGGDAPGRALLVDGTGRVLREQAVEMVNLVQILEWRPRAVEISPFGEWPLPP